MNLSKELLAFFLNPDLAETPKADNPAFDNAAWISLLSSADLCTAAKVASQQGFHIVVDNCCDEWEYRDAAAHLLRRLQELRRNHPRVCLISAGEVSVQIPNTHGVGGRNQQFTLECARLIAEQKMSATVLSGG